MAYLNGKKILMGSNVTIADLSVDQDYNPESENAQSGKAVAQAVANLGGGGNKVFEKIATITVAPDTDGTLPTKIIFSIDDNGQPFELTDLYCHIRAGVTTASRIQVKANGGILISNCDPQFSSSLRYWYFRFDSFGENNGGILSAPIGTMGNAFPSSNTGNGINLATPINLTYFNKIPKVEVNIFSGGGQWITDSTFELWGVRA